MNTPRTTKQAADAENDMLPEYRFAYRKTRPNRFAARMKEGSRAVLPDVEETKRKNIIEMALGFTAMIRTFAKGSKDSIAAKLDELFLRLREIRNRDDYELRHRCFCQWFTREIRTNARVQPSGLASYGQAAKVLDIAIKVYVYYSGQPAPEVAERIIPWLHGAIDTPIMKHLKKSKGAGRTIRATTIKGLDEEAYQALQSLVLAESLACKLHPVQYDDYWWRELNRRPITHPPPLASAS